MVRKSKPRSRRRSPAVPRASTGDVAHAIATGAVSSVPIIGGVAAGFVNAFFGPPIERRRESFFEDLVGTIRDLERRKLDMERLRHSEEFLDVVLRAAHSAQRTRSIEKRRMLLNAIRSTGIALGRPPSAEGGDSETTESATRERGDRNDVLMTLVEELTPSHIRLLAFFEDPARWHIARFGGTPGGSANLQEWIVKALPEMRDTALLLHLWRDLRSRGLVPDEELVLHESRRHFALMGMSRWLLKFIAEPEKDMESSASG